jgi:hypothetical protein
VTEPQDNLSIICDLREIRSIVDRQAADNGLWFVSETASEAYLQQELRHLHKVIEDYTKWLEK